MKTSMLRYLTLAAALGFGALLPAAHAAISVGPGGHTNDFSAQPAASEWSTLGVPGAAGDITNVAGLDAAVQTIAASTITAQCASVTVNPPNATGPAVWSTNGYLQTRPTGVGYTLLLATLINNTGSNVATVNIQYEFRKVAAANEPVEGHQVYYSLTGAPNSWTNIPALSSAAPGTVSASLGLTWSDGSTLRLVLADENGPPSPDTACQIDNFSVTTSGGVPASVPPLDGPRLSVSRSDAGIEIRWGSETSSVYQVQWTSSLPGEWQDIDVPLEGTGGGISFSVSLVDSTSVRFYRIKVVPNDYSAFASPTATVAIHVSDATAQGWGVLGNADVAWKYWHIYGFLMEQLRSDGTPFVVVSDSDVACGRLVIRDSDIAADLAAGRSPRRRGTPKYAIVFCLANTCASDDVAAGIDGFVLAGGHAVVGSTSLTRNGACQARELPPYLPGGDGSNSVLGVIATAENEFPGYPASATINNSCASTDLWLNAINDQLPTWIQYVFYRPDGGMPTIAKVALVHSSYEEQGGGYAYRMADYDVQISVDPNCAENTFSTVSTERGNDINREYQIVCFQTPQPARCVRIVARSSHERKPYPGHDTTQWVGLSGFQAFDANGNALIRNACVAGDPWSPLGLRPLQVDDCFDHIRLTPAGVVDSLLSHFERDTQMRGYRLALSHTTILGYNQLHHWGQAVALETPVGEPPATVLAVDDAVPGEASVCASGPEKPIFAKRSRGRGRYLYSASFNSLAGWTMHCSPSYVYGVYRHAIDEAHRATGLPNVRLGAWPWPHVAGFMTRHDHYPHFGFDGIFGTAMGNLDNTKVALIERYKDALTGGQTLRDFPVHGGYFLLNDGSMSGINALPNGSETCVEGLPLCDAVVRDTLNALLDLGAELGTHSYRSPGSIPMFPWEDFGGEKAKLRAYIGARADPAIYVSHGAYAHFDMDNDNGTVWVGIQTMAASNIVAKGEDAFGAHPHFALKISSATQYGPAARWPIVDIPATAYATQPAKGFWPPGLGIIAHEIAADLNDYCNTDSTPPRSCMRKAVDLVYALGGIINVYDHIGQNSSVLPNPTEQQFADYIDYAQGLPFVYTTSTRDIASWWRLRDRIRISRTVTQTTLQNGTLTTVRIAVLGKAQRLFSIELDLPSATTGDPTVIVNGNNTPTCPALTSGAQLKPWLQSAAVASGCYVRDGARIRIGATAPSTIIVRWIQ